jgi:hypothetical protein
MRKWLVAILGTRALREREDISKPDFNFDLAVMSFGAKSDQLS